MLTPVVIGTHPERTEWLADCLKAIRTTKPDANVFVHEAGGYEPAGILAGCERFDRFLYIHDSVIIKSRGFWTIIDDYKTAWLAGFPPMFLGIYKAEQIKPLMPTHQVSKQESITLEAHLPSILQMPTIWPDVTDTNHLRFETRHGRDNLVLGNTHFEKFKGTWS